MIETIDFSKRRAFQLIEEGVAHASQGRIHEARSQFTRSLELAPTAEGYTYLGWMLSFEGYIQEAIDLCKRAIEVDPTFGNPYNDIGSYLIRLGKLEDAIPWLEKATTAQRYQPKQFPHLNLSKIYLAQGKLEKAESELRLVLKYEPTNTSAHSLLAQIQKEKPKASK